MTPLTLVAGALLTLYGADPPSAHRDAAHVDASGLAVEREITEAFTRHALGPQPVGAGIIWHLHDTGSITESVAMSDLTDESWVGHNLNFERLGYHQTTGTNVPIYEFDVVTESPDRVIAGCAEDASLGVVMTAGTLGVSVRAFDDSSGNTPLWTYNFPEEYLSAFIRALDVSADGSIVAAVAFEQAGTSSLVVMLDGSDGSLLNSLPVSALVQAVELSDDGSRAILTQSATAVILETAGMTTIHSFTVSGGGGYHRLSRDGTVAAAGGFNLLVHKDTGGTWGQIWSQSQANNWFGNGLGLSANGDSLIVAQFNYATGYLTLTYRVIDLENSVELAMTTTTGTGAFQDTVVGAQASADGETFAVASWGTQDNVHPEVQVFDRDLNLIGSVDTPGSPFSIDMTADGVYLLVGGKAVHANTSGSGSDTYTYRIVSACPWDCEATPDGAVATADLLALLSQWAGSGPCDFDGGGVATADLLKLLGQWGPCP